MIKVPIPLRTSLGLNEREHWRARAKRNKSERNVAFWYCYDAAGAAGPILNRQPPLQITLTRIGPTNGLDDDNLCGSLKSVRDGVADWLGVQDNDKRLTWAYEQRREKTWSVQISIIPIKSATSSSQEAPAGSDAISRAESSTTG